MAEEGDVRQALWGEAMGSWLAEVERKSVQTRRGYESAWRKFYALVPKPPWEIERRDVVSFAQQLQDDDYTDGVVNSYVAAVSAFFGYVVDVHEPQLATRNPARGIDWLNVEGLQPVWITKAEVEQTLAAIPTTGLDDLRDLALIETLWRTALRNSAVRGIRLCDLREQGGQVWLRYKSKGKEGRRVFPDAAWRRVRTYLEARGRWADAQAALKGQPVDAGLYVFIAHASNATRHGDPERRPISREWLRDMTVKRTQAALGKAYKPHAFRHGAAHALDEMGVKLQDISRYLDHSSVDTTMRYLQTMRDHTAQLGNAL